jgi:signal transduction histidine kinase
MKLQTKITLLTTTILVIVVFFTLLPVRRTIMNTLRDELEKKGISIAGNLSDRIANSIILKDYFQTAKALNEVLKKEKDIEYIFVTNEDADMFADTFENGTPPGILDWNPLGNASQRIQLLETEKGYIRDVGVRVIDGTKSELHLGLREDMLKDTRMKMRYLTIPIIVFVVLLGVAASFVMSRFITNPLNKFVEFTKVLGEGEYGGRVDVRYGDEIGYLARNFNRLSMQLKTAREKMEEAYTYTHLVEAEKLSSIGQISAGLAHELKNPLTSLKMLFQAFKEQPDMTQEDAGVISSEIEKMDRVLSNFMGFVKQKGFHLSDTNLNELIERVLSLATFDINNANIVVRRDMLETIPHVKADRGLLEQVFLNLIINAVHAMPDGGEIRISGKSDDAFVEVMVWDKGGGIPDDIREKIFNPFFTTKEEGTGLGLAIAYNIVKSHGGKLFFNSELGRGTVFTVRLPIEAEHG